ncbi:xanthine dehydrogenase molybdopterin binding subunit [Siculibacillus lacustris]|uniref:Xanthine dehydrogenase molybdopterin binding subunit n=2 Tax=Siculibacillus lacustris TaxID=1549641 RepID=A0A4Q9VNK5_9HYPH|nr:xanthine dehydrogenase molybdopterin binding subunit [Siculibacillus lacustris]TBW37235.1 xanthine dehydrogenase molybdopterin binding subunit [Siculibacillus lacustris]
MPEFPPVAAPRSAVGAPLPHDSAARHVAGAAAYIDDLDEPAGTLHVAPGWCREVTRGRLLKVDLDAVRAHPGVVAVLTAADVPAVNDCSPSIGGDPVFAESEIQFWGQVVFAVVATSRASARAAARLAVFEVEAEKPAITVFDALDRGSDVLPPYEFRKGDAGAAIAAAPCRFADGLAIGGQEHFYLEGQIAFAHPREGDEILVLSSTQHPTEIQHVVARVLGLSDAAIVCECRRMGGGFGGKESQATQWAVIAALAARITGRSVKLRLDRDDDMVMTGKRHDFRVDWRVGTDETGRILGVDVDFLARCGASADLSQGVVDRTMFHADNAYDYPAARIATRRLLTDTVSATAFRGFGGPQGMLFAERMIDAVALRLGRDPLDVRKANFYPSVDAANHGVTPYGQVVDDCVLPDLVAALEQSSDYRARVAAIDAFNASSPILRRGIALTPIKFGISFTLTHLNQAGALVNVYSDGSVTVNHGGTEMGQGLYVKVAQVVAEVFAIPVAQVRITATTTGKVPNTAPTAASSGSDLNGMAAQIAAEEIRDRMAVVVAHLLGGEPRAVTFAGGRARLGDRDLSFADVARQCTLARVSLSATGFYSTPDITWDRAEAHGRPFYYYAYGAACSEVVIDTLTGEMRVLRVDILHDVGRSLNPAIDLGQIEGGFVQGLGWLTTEELVWDSRGRLRTHAPSTYKIPTAFDVPADFRVALWEDGGNRVASVHRSKAVGEPPVMLAISVHSAILRAIASLAPGVVPPLEAPATPEAILAAVRAVKHPVEGAPA